jgi:hypothetical protein
MTSRETQELNIFIFLKLGRNYIAKLIIPGLNLENGVGYVVMVRAIDFVGLSVEATSNEFTIDDTPPVPGWVSIVSTAADFNMSQITTRFVYSNILLYLKFKSSNQKSSYTSREYAIFYWISFKTTRTSC